MSGKYSRDKGARNERLLVDYFHNKSIIARRVPLSGACEGFKGDVEIDLGYIGKKYAELKTRKDMFTKIYGLLDGALKGKAGAITYEGNSAVVSYHFEDMCFNGSTMDIPFIDAKPENTVALKQINRYKKWLGSSDFLVLKNDFKRFIFIRYL